MKLTIEEKAYLAGLVDGEGSILLCKGKKYTVPSYILRVKVVNTNKQVIEWIQKRIKGRIDIRKSDNKWRTLFIWSIHKKEIIHNFLKAILPYLIIKKEQAKIALQFKNGQNPLSLKERIIRENLYQDLKLLNKKENKKNDRQFNYRNHQWERGNTERKG